MKTQNVEAVKQQTEELKKEGKIVPPGKEKNAGKTR